MGVTSHKRLATTVTLYHLHKKITFSVHVPGQSCSSLPSIQSILPSQSWAPGRQRLLESRNVPKRQANSSRVQLIVAKQRKYIIVRYGGGIMHREITIIARYHYDHWEKKFHFQFLCGDIVK